MAGMEIDSAFVKGIIAKGKTNHHKYLNTGHQVHFLRQKELRHERLWQ